MSAIASVSPPPVSTRHGPYILPVLSKSAYQHLENSGNVSDINRLLSIFEKSVSTNSAADSAADSATESATESATNSVSAMKYKIIRPPPNIPHAVKKNGGAIIYYNGEVRNVLGPASKTFVEVDKGPAMWLGNDTKKATDKGKKIAIADIASNGGLFIEPGMVVEGITSKGKTVAGVFGSVRGDGGNRDGGGNRAFVITRTAAAGSAAKEDRLVSITRIVDTKWPTAADLDDVRSRDKATIVAYEQWVSDTTLAAIEREKVQPVSSITAKSVLSFQFTYLSNQLLETISFAEYLVTNGVNDAMSFNAYLSIRHMMVDIAAMTATTAATAAVTVTATAETAATATTSERSLFDRLRTLIDSVTISYPDIVKYSATLSRCWWVREKMAVHRVQQEILRCLRSDRCFVRCSSATGSGKSFTTVLAAKMGLVVVVVTDRPLLADEIFTLGIGAGLSAAYISVDPESPTRLKFVGQNASKNNKTYNYVVMSTDSAKIILRAAATAAATADDYVTNADILKWATVSKGMVPPPPRHARNDPDYSFEKARQERTIQVVRGMFGAINSGRLAMFLDEPTNPSFEPITINGSLRHILPSKTLMLSATNEGDDIVAEQYLAAHGPDHASLAPDASATVLVTATVVDWLGRPVLPWMFCTTIAEARKKISFVRLESSVKRYCTFRCLILLRRRCAEFGIDMSDMSDIDPKILLSENSIADSVVDLFEFAVGWIEVQSTSEWADSAAAIRRLVAPFEVSDKDSIPFPHPGREIGSEIGTDSVADGLFLRQIIENSKDYPTLVAVGDDADVMSHFVDRTSKYDLNDILREFRENDKAYEGQMADYQRRLASTSRDDDNTLEPPSRKPYNPIDKRDCMGVVGRFGVGRSRIEPLEGVSSDLAVLLLLGLGVVQQIQRIVDGEKDKNEYDHWLHAVHALNDGKISCLAGSSVVGYGLNLKIQVCVLGLFGSNKFTKKEMTQMFGRVGRLGQSKEAFAIATNVGVLRCMFECEQK
jgi:hypothetical protein